mmetsp:Transcript_22434/g.48736  ORF Transcript_22434/g.48736 Transcript_22434/m.48736 type:complete len:132 (+) Transcript_22434:72-467(+)|eukprot:CAMPEP_0178578588 /NCGR_PEP_ID=MMETSP0697-20121206/21629_1 /TAXON_ID=265572 /ORGANISM="Extubocellulus spinifer, Strain CCMP396" /LENGTH=131 /DNA_ID=CAMNT_0020213979 /DNA_START=45 /DNA_END=440 /DNA_ORIENTATION=+
MNGLRNTITRTIRQEIPVLQRRFASGQAIPQLPKYSAKKAWFSDPATYPIIVVMGCAVTFMTGAGIHALTCYKDVQVDPTKRNSKLQTWGKEDSYTPLVGKAVGWNMYGKEGLGVDHEKWQKEHDEYVGKK